MVRPLPQGRGRAQVDYGWRPLHKPLAMNRPMPPADTKIRAASAEARDAAAPVFYDAGDPAQRAELARLLESERPPFIHDTIRAQLGEVVELQSPERKLSRPEIDAGIERHLAGRDLGSYGTWIHFPWSGRLVHTLPVEEFREVRSARNRYKITASEQEKLRAARIGVVGLSVGNMAAITFALEGIGGEFRVADFDDLSLSNLNRLRGGIADLGINKTVLAAREMYEIDPYLLITRFAAGITPENMDDFLLDGGPIDLLVEECDDLYVKLAIRERCRELRIPVIMDTSDRGLLDIERFDLEPERPILHGLVGNVRAEMLKGLPTKEKVPIVLSLLGGHAMSRRMAASLPEVEQSIATWPQLASGVALGGAITADAARRILLGEYTESGRYYVDVEMLVRNGTGLHVDRAPAPSDSTVSAEAQQPRIIPAPPKARQVDAAAARWIVAHAVLSPSAHNAQPWSFRWRHDRLEVRHDPAHDLPTLDFQHTATWLTFGCVAETITLAARVIGLEPEIALFPDKANLELVLSIHFTPRTPETDPLYAFVAERVTNRRRDARRPLERAAASALTREAEQGGCRLQLIERPEQLDEMALLVGACDRLSAMSKAIHSETMTGYRWTREEVEAHRDGIDVATLELTAAESAGMRLLSEWEVMSTLRTL